MGVMSTSLPPLDTIKHLLERLKANDVAWFRERYKAGDLAWLKDRLPAGGYEKLGERIEAGDLGWLRERIATLPGMNIPGLDLGSFGLGNIGGAAAGAATGALKGATSLGTAGAGAAAAAVGAGRKRGLWFIPILLLAAIVAALLMKQCNKDDETATDSEVATSEVEATEAGTSEATEAMVAETTGAMAAETTAAAAASSEAAPAGGGDIVATALGAGNFKTLTAALGAAGLTETLQGPGPFTVFAPTDEAFAKLPTGAVDALLKPENKPILTQILTYHVVGAKVAAADVKSGPAKSIEGSDLDLVSADGKVTVNGANVTTADVASSNGIIHVIDAVLIPKSVDVAALLGGAAAPATEAAVAATEAAVVATEAAAPATEPAAPVNAAGDAVAEDLTVYFANGSAAINAEGKAKITKAVATLGALPAGTKVNVVGHASAVGDPAKNQKLSEARANNVIAALKAGLGAKASNVEFAASAEGDKNPVDNADKSRRVTVEIQK
jgi:uncharacterized surface protein with fasciclin (FAS1) repeats